VRRLKRLNLSSRALVLTPQSDVFALEPMLNRLGFKSLSSTCGLKSAQFDVHLVQHTFRASCQLLRIAKQLIALLWFA